MNKKSIYQKLLRTAATLAGTNMKRRAVTLGVVVMTMIALPTKALADDYVASVTIGSTTTNYATLPEAVTAANAAMSDVTVTMLGDVNLNANGIEFNNANTDITLELNGKTITASISDGSVFTISETTTLIINDNSVNGNGGIINNEEPAVEHILHARGITNSGVLAINGGNISAYSIGIYNSGEITINNATISVSGNSPIWNEAVGSITIEDGYFSGGSYGISNGGTLIVNGGTFNGWNSGIANSGESGDATINGGNITGYYCGISNFPSKLTVCGGNISGASTAGISHGGGTFVLKAIPTFDSGNSTDIKLTNASIIDFTEATTPLATGELTQKIKVDAGGAPPFAFTKGYKAAFTDGTTGATVDPADVFTVSGANIVLAGGEAIAYDPDKPLVAVNTDADGDIENLYTVDGTTYTTDVAALTAAVNALADGSTLTLCKDVDLGDDGMYLWIKKGTAAQPVTIDLNGKKITVKREDCVLVVGDDNSTPTVIIKNGTIENSHTETGHGIMNYGNLTMSGGSVTGYYGIRNLGILTVSGGTVEGKGSFAIENYSNAISCTIGAATIKSDNNLGIKAEVNVTLTAWPTFSGNSTDIDLADVEIVLGDGFAVPTTEFNKMKVKAAGDDPFTITSGYAAHCTDAQSNVIDPASVFTWTGDDNYVFVLDDDEVVVRKVTVITLPAGLSTYYEGHGLRVSNGEGNGEGVKIYAVTAVSDDQVTLKEISSRTIPKNTPVIISNTNNSEVYCLFEYPYDTDSENQFAQTFSTDMGTAITAPEFTGTAIGKTGYNPPVTLYGFNGAAFVKMDGPVDIAAHRCWIEIGDAMTIGGARKLSIVFDDETTGIKEVKEVREVKEVKADTWYTVDGRKLEKAPSRKGIYIQNGKKLVIK